MVSPRICSSSGEKESFHSSGNEPRRVGVAVRVRPLSTQELANSSVVNCIQCLKHSVIIGAAAASSIGAGRPAKGLSNGVMPSRPRNFEVDTVFHQHSTQKDVYNECCHSVVQGLFSGINGAILAYGATGSGKTHTMFGSALGATGVVNRAAQHIFDEKTKLELQHHAKVTVKCSFIEIYNENVYDLLVPPRKTHRLSVSTSDLGTEHGSVSPANTNCNIPLHQIQANEKTRVPGTGEERIPLPLREGKATKNRDANADTLQIPGLTYIFPNSVEEFSGAIENGRRNRFVASTGANSQSSRSHAIIIIEVHVSPIPGVSAFGTVARIKMCDLAGSERAASTSNSGMRLREGGNINRSLLALGAVVQSLVAQATKSSQRVFTPYRGSCLTRLLKDSLGGNCQTQMIFCLNPSSVQQEESVNTMLFAMKGKQLEVAAERNEFRINPKVMAHDQEMLIDDLRKEVKFYQKELQRYGIKLESGNVHKLPTQDGQEAKERLELETVRLPSNNEALSSASDRLGSEIETQPFVCPISSSSFDMPNSTSSSTAMLPLCKSSSFAEVCVQFEELENKMKELLAEKDAHYWKSRGAQERVVARDLELRELKWRLARFLASHELGIRVRGDPGTTSSGVAPTPVGVAGMRSTIAAVEKEQSEDLLIIEGMMKDIDRLDRSTEALRNELPHDKQHPVLEVLFDNMKLKQNCTEAEHLAAEYHQNLRQTKARINEYQEALSVCVSALHSVIPHLSHKSMAMADAKLALFYAHLPHAPTADMIRVFEASLQTDSTPPLISSRATASPTRQRFLPGSDDWLNNIQELEDSIHSLTISPHRSRRSQGQTDAPLAQIAEPTRTPLLGIESCLGDLSQPEPLSSSLETKLRSEKNEGTLWVSEGNALKVESLDLSPFSEKEPPEVLLTGKLGNWVGRMSDDGLVVLGKGDSEIGGTVKDPVKSNSIKGEQDDTSTSHLESESTSLGNLTTPIELSEASTAQKKVAVNSTAYSKARASTAPKQAPFSRYYSSTSHLSRKTTPKRVSTSVYSPSQVAGSKSGQGSNGVASHVNPPTIIRSKNASKVATKIERKKLSISTERNGSTLLQRLPSDGIKVETPAEPRLSSAVQAIRTQHTPARTAPRTSNPSLQRAGRGTQQGTGNQLNVHAPPSPTQTLQTLPARPGKFGSRFSLTKPLTNRQDSTAFAQGETENAALLKTKKSSVKDFRSESENPSSHLSKEEEENASSDTISAADTLISAGKEEKKGAGVHPPPSNFVNGPRSLNERQDARKAMLRAFFSPGKRKGDFLEHSPNREGSKRPQVTGPSELPLRYADSDVAVSSFSFDDEIVMSCSTLSDSFSSINDGSFGVAIH